MNRRELLKAAFAGAIAARELAAQAKVERATRGMAAPRIKDISVIATAPQGLRLVVVKITTDQDGLYGYGCATFTQRADLVVPAIEKYLKPARPFEFWESDEEFYRVAAKTPRSNCVMDITKMLSAGVKIRPVGEALEHSLINWQPEQK